MFLTKTNDIPKLLETFNELTNKEKKKATLRKLNNQAYKNIIFCINLYVHYKCIFLNKDHYYNNSNKEEEQTVLYFRSFKEHYFTCRK